MHDFIVVSCACAHARMHTTERTYTRTHTHARTPVNMMKAYRIGPRGDRRFRAEDVDVFLLGERNVVPVVVNK